MSVTSSEFVITITSFELTTPATLEADVLTVADEPELAKANAVVLNAVSNSGIVATFKAFVMSVLALITA